MPLEFAKSALLTFGVELELMVLKIGRAHV